MFQREVIVYLQPQSLQFFCDNHCVSTQVYTLFVLSNKTYVVFDILISSQMYVVFLPSYKITLDEVCLKWNQSE